jgi:hypothetical protein
MAPPAMRACLWRRYRYELSQRPPSGRAEPFQFVKLRVADLAKSAAFYQQTLGMSDLSTVFRQVGQDPS